MRVSGRICLYFCNVSDTADFFSLAAAPTFVFPVTVFLVDEREAVFVGLRLAPPRISKTVCNEVGFTRNGVPRIIAARYLANVGEMRHAIAINMAKPIDVLIFHSSFTEIRHLKVALECLRCSKYRKLRGRGSTTLSSCLLIPYNVMSLQKVTDCHIACIRNQPPVTTDVPRVQNLPLTPELRTGAGVPFILNFVSAPTECCKCMC